MKITKVESILWLIIIYLLIILDGIVLFPLIYGWLN